LYHSKNEDDKLTDWHPSSENYDMGEEMKSFLSFRSKIRYPVKG
jgi:hypothetical protein